MRMISGRALTHIAISTVLWGGAVRPVLAEGCFRTAREAALSSGVRDGEGFRLEGIQVDRLAGGRWATVRSCLHPERPGAVVKLPADARPEGAPATSATLSPARLPVPSAATAPAGHTLTLASMPVHLRKVHLRPALPQVDVTQAPDTQTTPAQAASAPNAVLVTAGQQVQVVRVEGSSRFETVGVAEGSAALGAHLRVRLANLLDQAEQHFADTVVLSAGVVELEAAQ